MKVGDRVRRTLADAALAGRRRWSNLGDVAHEARCSPSAVFKATRHLTAIGAIRKYGSGGLSVIDPERVVLAFAVTRDLESDTIVMTDEIGANSIIGEIDHYAIGGPDAAIHYLGGINNVADPGQRIVYVSPLVELPKLPEGSSVRIMRMDEVAERLWESGYSSVSQTYADLFAQPGWQASEFRRALWRKLFATDDWAQSEVDVGAVTL